MNRFLAVLFICSGVAGASSGDIEEGISVVGECLRIVNRDQAFVELTVEAKDQTPSAASKKASEQSERLRRALEAVPLSAQELSSSEYRVEEIREWDGKKEVPRGYKARIGIEIKTKDFKKFEEALGLAKTLGVQQVGRMDTNVSTEKLKTEREACLQEAAVNARAKAEKLVSALGGYLGPLLALDELSGHGDSTPVYPRAQEFSGLAKSMAPLTISPGTSEIRIAIRAKFKVK